MFVHQIKFETSLLYSCDLIIAWLVIFVMLILTRPVFTCSFCVVSLLYLAYIQYVFHLFYQYALILNYSI